MRTMESGLCIELFKQSRRRRWRICNLKSVFALFQTSVPLFQIGQFVKCRWIFLELSSKRHWGRLYERKWAAAYVRRKRNYFYGYGLHKTRTARINDSRFSSPLDRSNGDVVCFCTSHDFQQWLERSKLRNDWLRSGNSHILRYFFSFKFIFRSRLLCGAVQLNLCGNLDENFVSDQSGGLKEMFQQVDEVEFRQYFSALSWSRSFSRHCSACLGYEGLGYNWIESMRSICSPLQQSRGQRLSALTNTFTSKVSRDLDKPSPNYSARITRGFSWAWVE